MSGELEVLGSFATNVVLYVKDLRQLRGLQAGRA
jgi:hypothetical protein